jgi:hypothetical protein
MPDGGSARSSGLSGSGLAVLDAVLLRISVVIRWLFAVGLCWCRYSIDMHVWGGVSRLLLSRKMLGESTLLLFHHPVQHLLLLAQSFFRVL